MHSRLFPGTMERLLWGKFHVNIIYAMTLYDEVIKWKYFSRYWPFVRGIHRSPVKSPHKGQWRWALVFSLICTCKTVEQTIVRLVIWDVTVLIMTSLKWLSRVWQQEPKSPVATSSGVVVRSTGTYEKLSDHPARSLLPSAWGSKRHHPEGKVVTCAWTLTLG